MSSKIIQLCPNMSKHVLVLFLVLALGEARNHFGARKISIGLFGVATTVLQRSAKSSPICSGIQLLPHELLLCLR